MPNGIFRSATTILPAIAGLPVVARAISNTNVPTDLKFIIGDLLRPQTVAEHLEPQKSAGTSDVEAFISLLRQDGVARSDRFVVEFHPPSKLNVTSDTLRTLSLVCEETTLPGKSITTRVARINALSEHRAGGVDFTGESIAFQFYIDGNYEARNFFEKWMNIIVDPKTREVSFYRDYIGEVTIKTLEMSNQAITETKLEECFPRSVNVVPLSYTDGNVMRLQVIMTFKRWSTQMLHHGAPEIRSYIDEQLRPMNPADAIYTKIPQPIRAGIRERINKRIPSF